MKLFFTTIVGSLCLFVPAAAADLTGEWVRDGAQSDTVPNHMYWLTRGVEGGGTRGPDSSVVLIIQQQDNQLRISDPAEPQRAYILDGITREVPTDTGVQTARVTAKTEGEAVVVDRRQPYGGLPGNVTLDIQQSWQLSPDGGTLVLVTTRNSPAIRHSYTEVFRKR